MKVSFLIVHQVPEEQNSGRISVIGTVYRDNHDNAHENNGTLDYVLNVIFVENIVHISVDVN